MANESELYDANRNALMNPKHRRHSFETIKGLEFTLIRIRFMYKIIWIESNFKELIFFFWKGVVMAQLPLPICQIFLAVENDKTTFATNGKEYVTRRDASQRNCQGCLQKLISCSCTWVVSLTLVVFIINDSCGKLPIHSNWAKLPIHSNWAKLANPFKLSYHQVLFLSKTSVTSSGSRSVNGATEWQVKLIIIPL